MGNSFIKREIEYANLSLSYLTNICSETYNIAAIVLPANSKTIKDGFDRKHDSKRKCLNIKPSLL